MRMSLRTAAQVILFITLVIFLNGYIVLFYDQKRHSEVKKSSDVSNSLRLGTQSRERGKFGTKTVDNSTDPERHGRNFILDSLQKGNRDITKGHHKVPNMIENDRNNLKYKSVLESSKNWKRNFVTGHSKLLPKQNHNDSRVVSEIFTSDIDYSLDFSESRPTELSDIFISVKTTKRYHKLRVELLLSTWARLAKDETYFFTDTDDKELENKTRGHVINTNCSAVHSRMALCCKMSVEYDYFIASRKRWFCHVDDDTYINIPELSRLLKKFNHTEDWYLGKPSLTHPLEISDPEHKGQKVAFWFATGGAGMCISRSLALKMMPYTAGGRLQSVCATVRLPDDCSIGFIIYNYLKKELTVISQFHSHLEGLWLLKPENMDQQITLSYNRPDSGKLKNIVHVSGGFSEQDDPTRFRSIHCQLFPYLEGCPRAAHT